MASENAERALSSREAPGEWDVRSATISKENGERHTRLDIPEKALALPSFA